MAEQREVTCANLQSSNNKTFIISKNISIGESKQNTRFTTQTDN